MRLSGTYGLKLKDHDLEDAPENQPKKYSTHYQHQHPLPPSFAVTNTVTNTSESIYTTAATYTRTTCRTRPINTSTQCTSSTHHHDLHKTTITSYCFSKNEKQFNRFSKNNLLIAQHVHGRNGGRSCDCGHNNSCLESRKHVELNCFVNPIILFECDRIQFLDSKFNQTNNRSYGECDNIVAKMDLLRPRIAELIVRLVLIINSCDHNFVSRAVRWRKSRQCCIGSRFGAQCFSTIIPVKLHFVHTISSPWTVLANNNQRNNYETSNCNDNTSDTICDIFCTKLRQHLVKLKIGIEVSIALRTPLDACVDYIEHFKSCHIYRLKCRLKTDGPNDNGQHIGDLKNVNHRSRRKRRKRSNTEATFSTELKTKIDYTLLSQPLPPSIPCATIQVTSSHRQPSKAARSKRRSCRAVSEISSSQLVRHYSRLLLLVVLALVPTNSATMHNVKYSTQTVQTKYGPLRGIIVRTNPTVEAFLGVPYATPPVGSLRFMPPVTPSTWRSPRLADRFSPVCPQAPPIPGEEALFEIPRGRLAQLKRLLPLLVNQSEDCLYLNLYVPRSDDTREVVGNSMATIVYVHGESYEWNSGNPYDGSILAAHGNVIVVTINFRLGVLGFLKTGAKGSAQGNFGLMDLVAGLHWLRENLPAFNGDASKVTLMGHGTGASLANILIVSPVASDLINRAILLSGSALSPWAIQKDPLYVKRKVAERTGCHGDLLEDDLAPCLRTRPVAELLSVTIDSPRFLPGFAPFVDGTVIVNPATSATSPLTLPAGSAIASTSGIELADFPTKELLFGLTSTESYLDLSAQDLEFGFNETRRDRILRTYVRNVYHYHLNEIYSALKNEYTDWERPPRNPMGSRDASLELLSDGHTAAPLVRLGYLHSLRGGRSYFLHFRHQSGERDFPQRGGSVRGEDVPFCLGLPISTLFPHNYTKQDIQISRILVQYIANFAQTGNPNETPSSSSVDISHNTFIHNHIATPSGAHSKLSAVVSATGDNNPKQKRQSNLSSGSNSRRTKRTPQHSSSIASQHLLHNTAMNDVVVVVDEELDKSESDELDEVDENDEDEVIDSAEETTLNRDRLDEMTNLRIPFWDTYDSINQLYLEMGNKIEIRNHYRGHKLSMWLSLIPQLHSPGDLAELSMRHHHFLEESAQFYDGIVRPQTLQRPTLQKAPPTTTTTTAKTTTTTTTTTTPIAAAAAAAPKIELTSLTAVLPSTTTECPPNTTIVPTLAATRPQHQPPHPASNSIASSNNLLRRLANSQYQSYTTALTVTIAVGCFLLLLNILIFAGIYYQREKRATDAKKKEELTEAEQRCSPSSMGHDKCGGKNSRKSSLQSTSGFNLGGSFGEYSCYDEKIQCKEKHALADICSVELPLQEFKCASGNGTNGGGGGGVSGNGAGGGSESNTNSLRRNHLHNGEAYKHSLTNLMLYPPTYSTQSGSSSASTVNGLVTYHQFHKSQPAEQCNQSTQSEPPRQDVGTSAMDKDSDQLGSEDGEVSPGIPEPPPPPRSVAPFGGGGILRQQGGPQTPSATKKRVQIQEISV